MKSSAAGRNNWGSSGLHILFFCYKIYLGRAANHGMTDRPVWAGWCISPRCLAAGTGGCRARQSKQSEYETRDSNLVARPACCRSVSCNTTISESKKIQENDVGKADRRMPDTHECGTGAKKLPDGGFRNGKNAGMGSRCENETTTGKFSPLWFTGSNRGKLCLDWPHGQATDGKFCPLHSHVEAKKLRKKMPIWA